MISGAPELRAVFKRIPLLQSFEPEDFDINQLAGFTNYNFRLRYQHHDWILRIPKSETNRFINRSFEARNVEAVIRLGLAPEIIWRDDTGLSLATCCSQARTFGLEDMRNESTLTSLVNCLARLHQQDFEFYGEINLPELITRHFELVPEHFMSALKPCLQTANRKLSVIGNIDGHKVPSHNDLVLENLLIQSDRRIWIIDWEYSATTSPYWDLATLCNSARFDAKQNRHLLEHYRQQAFDLSPVILRDYQYVLQFLTVCWMATFSDQQLSAELAWLEQVES